MELKLDFKFDAAHRLMHHKGLCQNVHGHSFKVRVTLSGSPDPVNGMILDFTDLKRRINVFLDEYDHCIILNKDDNKVAEAMRDIGMPFIVTPGEPTCENIVKEFYRRMQFMFPTTPRLIEVQVWESDTASAICRSRSKE